MNSAKTLALKGLAVITLAAFFLQGAAEAKNPNPVEPYVYFTTYPAKTPEEHSKAYKTLCFVCASFSQEAILEKCTPQKLPGTLHTYRLSLNDIKWSVYDWNKYVASKYPYATFVRDSRYPNSDQGYYWPSITPEIYRADWFISFLSDSNQSPAAYSLLYGENNAPRDKSSFLKFWQIDNDPYYSFGLIETESGVSKRRMRFIGNHALKRGYVWGTKDFLKIDPTIDADPFKYPIPEDKNLKHDGEEWILGIPKFSSVSGTRGALQVYALFDKAGKRIEKADGDLVEDHTRYKGYSQIRTAGSCIQCHANGINEPHKNGIRELLLATKEGGQEFYAKYKDKEALEKFYLSDSSTEISRNNEDYQAAIFALNGCTTTENAKNFTEVVNNYFLETVSLKIAAEELTTTEEELSLALAWESGKNKRLGYALTSLPHEHTPLNRETWEAVYLQAYYILQQYRSLRK